MDADAKRIRFSTDQRRQIERSIMLRIEIYPDVRKARETIAQAAAHLPRNRIAAICRCRTRDFNIDIQMYVVTRTSAAHAGDLMHARHPLNHRAHHVRIKRSTIYQNSSGAAYDVPGDP